MTFRERVLSRIVRHLGDPAPSLRIVFWDGAAVSFVPAPSVTITLRSRRLGRMLLAGNIDGLADAYVCGDLSVDGRLNDVLHVGIGIAERLGRSGLVRTVAKLLRGRPRRHAKRRDAAAIAHHYDVSNDFYALWLDQRMIYSCAYFRTGQEDLDAAQTQKLAHICRKLRLQPGESLLDIGLRLGRAADLGGAEPRCQMRRRHAKPAAIRTRQSACARGGVGGSCRNPPAGLS